MIKHVIATIVKFSRKLDYLCNCESIALLIQKINIMIYDDVNHETFHIPQTICVY